MFLSSLNNSWITHLAGFYKFESSQGVHLTSMNALAKINKQRTEKKRKRSCMKFCNGKARLWPSVLLTGIKLPNTQYGDYSS